MVGEAIEREKKRRGQETERYGKRGEKEGKKGREVEEERKSTR